MNVTYLCPHCQNAVRRPLKAGETELAAALECGVCKHTIPIPSGMLRDGRLHGCVVCAGGELYVRKDFSQRLGVAIVVTGFAISIVTWYYYMIYVTYAVLFAAALIDALLYLIVGNMLQCYRCQAQYRDVPGLEEHSPFNLETHERYRQQAARLAQSVSSSTRT